MRQDTTGKWLAVWYKTIMKEIDFLPEWYKSGKRRQVNYRLQYIILSGVFAVMLVWNLVSANATKEAWAKNMEMKIKQEQSEKVSADLDDLKKEISSLYVKEEVLDSTDSKIAVSNVLAEISYLVGEKIVLSRIDLISEKIPDRKGDEKTLQSVSSIRYSASSAGNNVSVQVGNIRFKVIIEGVAANASDVAVFLCKMEDSPYFSHVDLSYSKDAKVKKATNSINNSQEIASGSSLMQKAGNNSEDSIIGVSEFEIRCYISNYHQ